MPKRKKSEQDIADAAPAPQLEEEPKREDGPPPPGFKLRHTLRGRKNAINRIAWSPDGLLLGLPSEDNNILIWNTQTGSLHKVLEGHTEAVRSISWSPDDHVLASGSVDKSIRFWDVESEKSQGRLEEQDAIRSIAWSPDGLMLASGLNDDTVHIWDLRKKNLRHILRGHSSIVWDVAFSPDGKIISSCSLDNTIRLWDAETGKLHQTLVEHSSYVVIAAWMPDGQLLATGSGDSTVRLWINGTVNKILEGHSQGVICLSFSADGRVLASKSQDDTVRLWRSDTLETIAILSETTTSSAHAGLAFHPTDPTILATLGEEDSVIRIWELDYDTILANAPKHKSVHYTTARIALVGDSGVGKTGLGWRLAHGEFKDHPSTHGQQFWVIGELGTTRTDGTECEAVLWDLAGQPDYRLVHALFLDEVDQALVLFDPANSQEPLKGVEYWLKQLAHRREKPPGMVLVGARADRGTPTLTSEELDEFCRQNGIAGGFISTSAMTGAGLDELMARIKAAIDWDAMPATVTTATFKRVKEYVLGLKADTERKGVLVGPQELRVRLEATDKEWQFSDAEMMTAVGHLANHGYVSVLRGSSGEETILLAPDLLANLAASIVLEARRNPRGLGALEETQLLAGGYKFPELAGLEKHERDVLLDAAVALFLKHNVCFRETLGVQTFLVFPALINQKRPQLDEVATVDDVSYAVSGAVENVYAALVVLLGYTNTFTRTNQWQNQAQYETAGSDLCGFRQIADREGEIELVLYYGEKKTAARLLFQGLFEQFLNGRDVTVTRFPPIACPKCKYRQERGEVVRRIREGRGFLYCGECGKKIALPKAGEQIALSQADRAQVASEQERTRARTAFETALVRIKAAVRDRKRGPKAPRCFISYAWGVAEQERWVRGLATDLANAGIDVILDRKDNAQIGASIGRFIDRIEDQRVDFIVIVGTPLYRQKYENKLSSTGSVVAAEVDLIYVRLTGTEEQKNTVLPLLLTGESATSLPPLVRGRVYADFRDEAYYFAALFDLILTLYHIHVDHPAVADLREALWQDARRRL